MIDKFADILTNYSHCDVFDLERGGSIRSALSQNNVPNIAGVYIVYSRPDCKGDVIYIGKSGTVNQDGACGNQGLAGRLKNTHGKEPREKWFRGLMEHEQSGLSVAWYVTLDDECDDLPGYVEAKLIQCFYSTYQCLPKYNKSF